MQYFFKLIFNIFIYFLDEIDQSLIDSAKYLLDTISDFRSRLDNFIKRKNKNIQLENIDKAIIYVANDYPQWQKFIINELKNIFGINSSFPDNKSLAAHFKDQKEIDVKYQKKVMPFVSHIVKLVQNANNDINVLNKLIDFDEYKTLIENQQYMKNTLKIDQLYIQSINESDSTDSNNLDDVVPGNYFILILIFTFIYFSRFTCYSISSQTMNTIQLNIIIV